MHIHCPLKYRLYAHRIHENVPMFKEHITLCTNKRGPACPNFLATLATKEHIMPCCPREVEDIVSVPDVVIDDPTHRQALDIVTRRTSMSKRALRLEAQTPKHLASYFPHSPYCDTCMRANLIQSRFHRTTPAEDDQLPATTSPEQRLSADTIIITREATRRSEGSNDR